MLSSDSPRFREDFDITKSWFSQGSVWVASRKIILDSGQFDNNELGTMQGDSIGDTVYSAKWILNIVNKKKN
ncbi:hypothetical protein M0802_001008 [Mischocyttarus mexicanus]|nr:hypothetical protein M0802_001008 [Mischocyttarus mexicanus]